MNAFPKHALRDCSITNQARQHARASSGNHRLVFQHPNVFTAQKVGTFEIAAEGSRFDFLNVAVGENIKRHPEVALRFHPAPKRDFIGKFFLDAVKAFIHGESPEGFAEGVSLQVALGHAK